MREKSKNSCPVYVIAGKDKFIASGILNQVISGLLDAEQAATALYRVSGNSAQIAEVLDELRTLPFLSDKRVVVIDEADGFVSENRSSLEKYFDQPCKSGVLILLCSSWPKTTKLAKKLSVTGKLLSADTPSVRQMPGYAQKYLKDKYNKSFSGGAAHMLVEFAGAEPGRICSECDKLAVYCDDSRVITQADVQKLTAGGGMQNAFAAIESIMSGSRAEAAEKLRDMFASDRSSEYTVTGAFAYHFRKMYQAKAMLEKGVPANTVAKKARVFYNQQAFFARLKKLSLGRIGEILAELGRIDYAIKTGGGSAQRELEKLTFSI